jgi:hypothetical protein
MKGRRTPEVGRVKSNQVFNGMRLQDGDQPSVVNAITVDGQPLHKSEPADKHFRRIRQYWKTLLQIGHFFGSPFAGPTETVRFQWPRRHSSELDEVLRCQINLVVLAQQSRESPDGDNMLF